MIHKIDRYSSDSIRDYHGPLMTAIPYHNYSTTISDRGGVFERFRDSMNDLLIWEIVYNIKKNLK